MPLSFQLICTTFWIIGNLCERRTWNELCVAQWAKGTSAESRDHLEPVQRGFLQDDLGGYNVNRELCGKETLALGNFL